MVVIGERGGALLVREWICFGGVHHRDVETTNRPQTFFFILSSSSRVNVAAQKIILFQLGTGAEVSFTVIELKILFEE